ncbi:hypothetical protein BSF42_17280 [Flavobacterium sp. ACN6]|nr:hypothetical protein BSF42_17280 [Flavobacterium sp. ACN6]
MIIFMMFLYGQKDIDSKKNEKLNFNPFIDLLYQL